MQTNLFFKLACFSGLLVHAGLPSCQLFGQQAEGFHCLATVATAGMAGHDKADSKCGQSSPQEASL